MVSSNSKVQSREAIIREATRLFKLKGYRGASLEDVASAFGVSRPALYHYFQSKQDILFAIYEEVSSALSDGAREILGLDLSAAVKFRRIVHHHATTVLEYAAAMAVYYDEEYELTAKQRRLIRARRRDYTDTLVGLYADGVAAGEFTAAVPPKLAVYVVIGACNWSYKWFLSGGEVSVAAMTEYIEQLLDGGYATRDGIGGDAFGG